MTKTKLPILPPSNLGIKTNLELRPDLADYLDRNVGIRELPLMVLQERRRIKSSCDAQGTPANNILEDYENRIHLVKEHALVLTVRNENGISRIVQIEIDVIRLLGIHKNAKPLEEDLEIALSITIDAITPLLEHPYHARYIMPGLQPGNKPAKCALWNSMGFRTSIPDVPLAHLHRLRHPSDNDGWPEKTKESVRFRNHDWALSIEMAKDASWNPLLLVTLTLRNGYLRSELSRCGSSEFHGITGARRIDLARVVQRELFQLEGVYIPVLGGKQNEDTLAKLVRIIALTAKANPSWRAAILRNADVVYLRDPEPFSDSRDEGLAGFRKAFRAEAAKLNRIPVRQLFSTEIITARPRSYSPATVDWPIHPLIAAARGDAPRPTTV